MNTVFMAGTDLHVLSVPECIAGPGIGDDAIPYDRIAGCQHSPQSRSTGNLPRFDDWKRGAYVECIHPYPALEARVGAVGKFYQSRGG